MSKLKSREAIEILENGDWWNWLSQEFDPESEPSTDLHSAIDAAISALRRVQPANEPLTCKGQWVETASDNTDCVLAYADGIYCVTDADGHVICEFIRKPEPEGRENDGPTI